MTSSCLLYFAAAIQWFCIPDTRSRGRTQKRKSDTADVCKAEVERFAVKRGWRSFYHRNNNGCFQQKETPMNFRENVDKDGNTLDLDNAIGSSYYFIACSPYELGKPSEWDSNRHVTLASWRLRSAANRRFMLVLFKEQRRYQSSAILDLCDGNLPGGTGGYRYYNPWYHQWRQFSIMTISQSYII